MVKKLPVFMCLRGGALFFACSLAACDQSTNFSQLEAGTGDWQERYDHACHLSASAKRTLSNLTGEFQLDGEGEFPDALAVGSKRYLLIFKRELHHLWSSREAYEAAVASPHREGIKGIVYDGETTCDTFGPLDGTLFVLNVGKPFKSQPLRD